MSLSHTSSSTSLPLPSPTSTTSIGSRSPSSSSEHSLPASSPDVQPRSIKNRRPKLTLFIPETKKDNEDSFSPVEFKITSSVSLDSEAEALFENVFNAAKNEHNVQKASIKRFNRTFFIQSEKKLKKVIAVCKFCPFEMEQDVDVARCKSSIGKKDSLINEHLAYYLSSQISPKITFKEQGGVSPTVLMSLPGNGVFMAPEEGSVQMFIPDAQPVSSFLHRLKPTEQFTKILQQIDLQLLRLLYLLDLYTHNTDRNPDNLLLFEQSKLGLIDHGAILGDFKENFFPCWMMWGDTTPSLYKPFTDRELKGLDSERHIEVIQGKFPSYSREALGLLSLTSSILKKASHQKLSPYQIGALFLQRRDILPLDHPIAPLSMHFSAISRLYEKAEEIDPAKGPLFSKAFHSLLDQTLIKYSAAIRQQKNRDCFQLAKLGTHCAEQVSSKMPFISKKT